MVDIKLVRESKDSSVVLELTSPVVNGAWQFGEGPGAFHAALEPDYPNLTFVYCMDGLWQIHLVPNDDSMIEMAELISRVAQEETLYILGKLQYLANAPIPDLSAQQPDTPAV